MTTIGTVISRVRNQLKSVKQDAFLTDREIFTIVKKYAQLYMRRQDSLNRIMKFNSVFQPLDFVELIEVDKIQAECRGITSDCTIKRTKDKIPATMEGYYGPLIRSVSSLDGYVDVEPTFPKTFERIFKQKTFKYNKTKYYWFLNGYLFFPNIDWDAVKMEGVFEDNVSKYNCDTTDDCAYKQESIMYVPEFLFAEIEQNVVKDFSTQLQIPQDTQADNKNIIR